MRAWLFALASLLSGVASCSMGGTSTSGNADPTDSCHGPGCSNATGGSSSTSRSDASSPFAGSLPADDAGAAWSNLCGPRTGTCSPGVADEACAPTQEAGLDWVDASAAADSPADAGPGATCRIRLASPGSDSIELACESAGDAVPGSACTSTTDCTAGSTCVSDLVAPVCRQYCCEGPDSCPSGTYCTIRNTYVRTSNKYEAGANVPVCVPADNCNLGDPYPCPTDQKCFCGTGKACMIVRAGGLTTCLQPVEREPNRAECSGTAGISVCDPGYVCSQSTYSCLKLCKLTSNKASQSGEAAPCPTGTSCQASNDVPTGWGVCGYQPMVVN